MTYFDGERIVERETDRDEAGLLPREHRQPSAKTRSDRGGYGDLDTRRLGEDQRCGGGRRIVRKRIGD